MLLLMKDHKIRRKEDEEITRKDLKDSEYLLIDTSTTPCETSRNFVMIEPCIPYFTEAEVKYQIILVDNYEGNDHVDEVPITPVEMRTNKISDVINLLNCINRMNCVNEFIRNDQYTGVRNFLFISYFEIALYNDKKEIYHKIYSKSEHKTKKYTIRNILKVFKDIYDTSIIKDLYKKHEYLFLYKDMTWSLQKYDEKFEFIGLPLIGSRTITLCKDREFISINDCRKINFTMSIHEDYPEQRDLIKELIETCNYDELEPLNVDYFLVSSDSYFVHKAYKFFIVDMLSHAAYAIQLLNVVFHDLFDHPKDFLECNTVVDSILSITFYFTVLKNPKTLYMNGDTIVPLDILLKSLK